VQQEFPNTMTMYYEDLCDDVNSKLNEIYRFVGLDNFDYPGNVDSTEHHILGNTMRLSKITTIKNSDTWKTALSENELATIADTARDYAEKHAGHPLANIVNHYLDLI
jgi:hypothetical protein